MRQDFGNMLHGLAKVRSIPFATLIIFTLVHASPAWSTTVFFDDFDGGQVIEPSIVADLSAPASPVGVERYAGLGNDSNQFTGRFLRNSTLGNPQVPILLTLSGLPSHAGIDLDFLLAIIDSWDG